MSILTSDANAEHLVEAIDYITERVVNALLREDVRGLVSKAIWCSHEDSPFEAAVTLSSGAEGWLKCTQFAGGELWIPVIDAQFMQRWRVAGAKLIWIDITTYEPQWLNDYEAILMRLGADLPEQEADYYRAYLLECQTAVEHRLACLQCRNRWFDDLTKRGNVWPTELDWEGRLLFYDRLAACLDHPFFPTARAKLGLSVRDLQFYAPEFSPVFELNWLAIPRDRYQGTQESVPEFWPSFSDVGLAETLASTHLLMPIHPFLWDTGLEQFLADSELASEVIRAPQRYLSVRPTLSVRTLLLQDQPFTHIKVPLNMSSLGSKNYRTIKPSTIHDGHLVQQILTALASQDSWLEGKVMLTDEQEGGYVQPHRFLGFILRRFPESLTDATVVPIASLMAPGADGRLVIEHLAERFYEGDIKRWMADYLDLTLQVHLPLWLRYGIALESNQQNSMLVLKKGAQPMRLLLKDNDAPRMEPNRLLRARPDLAAAVSALRDQRILVEGEQPLVQMFTTITLQLNVAVLIEGLVERGHGDRRQWYRQLRQTIGQLLTELQQQGCDTDNARQALLEDETHYAKYLLRAASLESSSQTGASAVNKFYGKSAPNVLLPEGLRWRSDR